jgi:hypothetical protein
MMNLIGKRFGRLEVIGFAIKRGHRMLWECQCDCGIKVIVLRDSLTSGKTQSCGCLNRETTGNRSRTHGMSKTPMYNTWQLMRRRCEDKSNPKYAIYGGRGITVCDRWKSFDLFLADMGPKPKGKTIDRRDNDGPYDPDNCHWATPSQQSLNTRRNRWITFQGTTLTVCQWADKIGLDRHQMLDRLKNWPLEKALTTPKLTNATRKLFR